MSTAFSFFFQAEDGIRDIGVTGVQTCALPICWIAHETSRATREVTEAIEAYRFNDAANAIYRFVWNVYCDWYVELAKPVLLGEEGAAKTETRAMVAWARDEILKLLHPFMPFITEELWAVTAERDGLLVLAEWPRKAGATAEQIASMAMAGPN